MEEYQFGAIIATLGGTVYLGTGASAINELRHLNEKLIIALSVTCTQVEYHVHLKSFYKFIIESDGVEHPIDVNEELFLLIEVDPPK